MQGPYKSESSNLHKGHRTRLKEQYRKNGADALTDIQLLEMALFFAIPQGDTNALSHRLINRFGSLCAVLDAPYEQLMEVKGIGENSATFLRFVIDLARRYRLDKIDDDKPFESMEKIGRYLVAYFMGSRSERTVLMCFDRKRRLTDCSTVFSDGMAQMTQANIRRIAEVAMANGATGVVLAHNHTSGICEPSEYDITATNALDVALGGVGVNLIEHFLVTEEDYLPIKAYIRDNGYSGL